jgi:hypothetical protein
VPIGGAQNLAAMLPSIEVFEVTSKAELFAALCVIWVDDVLG